MDNRGPDSPHPEPEIAYGWPLSVETAHDRAYVTDLVNQRVVSAKLEPAVQTEVDLP
ncbi:MAG: hypothetical protein ACQESR_20920 [Planctomycetota bacterium]